MNNPTLYGTMITDITNRIHECSKVVESIECRTDFIRTFQEEEISPEDADEKADADLVKKATAPTELARNLEGVQSTINKLHQRLCDLDDSIYEITHL